MAFLISIPAAGWQHFPLCIPEATACEPVGEDGGKKGPVTVGGGKYQAQDAECLPGS